MNMGSRQKRMANTLEAIQEFSRFSSTLTRKRLGVLARRLEAGVVATCQALSSSFLIIVLIALVPPTQLMRHVIIRIFCGKWQR